MYDKQLNYTERLIKTLKVSNDDRKLITQIFKCYIYPVCTIPRPENDKPQMFQLHKWDEITGLGGHE